MMAMNKVQFQKGLIIKDFMAKFGTEEKCETALAVARWPNVSAQSTAFRNLST
jgi:hypothetical protein